MMFSPRFGTKKDTFVITERMLDEMPTRSLNEIVQRSPCFLDHDFDTNTITIIPVSESKWWGFYWGAFGSYEPKIGVVFETTGYKHIRFYLYKWTIILGRCWQAPLKAKVTLPDYPHDDGFDSRPQRFHSQYLDEPLVARTDLIAGQPVARDDSGVRASGFRLAERIDEGEARTDQAETRSE